MLLYDIDKWEKFWYIFYKMGLDKKYGGELEKELEKILFEIFLIGGGKGIDK